MQNATLEEPRESVVERPSTLAFRPDIEGIRAVAVIVVSLAHAAVPGFAGGFVGVDVFFVISGFLITSLLLRELATSGRVSVGGFYARRVRRILPASALVAVATMLYAVPAFGPARAGEIAEDGLWAGLFAANLRFIETGTDYFNRGASTSPLEHYWSLGVEEQFYLAWPLLLLGIGLLVVAPQRRRRIILGIVALLCLASFLWSAHQTSTAPHVAYFSPLTRVWELGLGAGLAALMLPEPPAVLRNLPRATVWVGLAMVMFAVTAFDGRTPYPGVSALVPVMGALLMVAGGERPGPVNPVLSAPWMQYVGLRSYGFYLWHLPFLILPQAVVGRALPWPVNLGLLVLAFLAAVLCYRYVEDPVRRSPWLTTRPVRYTLCLGVALVAAVVGTALVIKAAAGTPRAAVAETSYAALPTARDLPSLVAQGLEVKEPPADLVPALGRAEQDGGTTPDLVRCFTEMDQVKPNQACVYGDRAADRTIVITGDSHAVHWLPALDVIGKQFRYRVVPLAQPGCPPLTGVDLWNRVLDGPYPQCRDFRENANALINQLRPELVILHGMTQGLQYVDGSGRPAEAGGEDSRGSWMPSAFGVERWARGLTETIERLRPSGAELYVLSDTAYPVVLDGSEDCVWSHRRDVRPCVNAADEALFETLRTNEQEATESAGATWVDTAPWFCRSGACPPIIAGIQVYSNHAHMSQTYGRHLARVLAEAVGLER